MWSVYSVRDVRDAFWRAWESGKTLASRWTMCAARTGSDARGRETIRRTYLLQSQMYTSPYLSGKPLVTRV